MISDERLKEILGALCTDSLHDYEQVFDGIKNGEIGDMAKELLALRNQPVSQHYKLPDGWRLVPDEPTEEMMRAMHQAQDMWPSAHCDNMRETQMSFARPRYIAALATAPKPPTDSTT